MTKEQATDILIRYTNDGEGIFIEGDTAKIKEALSMAIDALAGCNSDNIRPITDDRRWRAVINEEKGTLEFYRDDENGKWTYEEMMGWGKNDKQ